MGCEDGIVTSGAYAASSIAAHTSLAIAKERSSAQISSPNIVIQASHNTKYAEAYVTGSITLKEIRRRSESDSLFDYADRSTVAIAYVINESDYEFSLKETVEALRPFPTDAEVIGKFRKLAATVIPASSVDQLCDLVLGLDNLVDARKLTDALGFSKA